MVCDVCYGLLEAIALYALLYSGCRRVRALFVGGARVIHYVPEDTGRAYATC